MFLIKKKKKHEGKFIGRQMIARNGFISTGKTARIYPKMLAILTTEQYIIRDFYNLIYVSLKKKTIFKAFSVHSKIERKVQRFPLHPLPHTCIVSPIISICCQSDAFMTIVETPLTQYNQLLSTVYTMARPWCGASRVWTNP